MKAHLELNVVDIIVFIASSENIVVTIAYIAVEIFPHFNGFALKTQQTSNHVKPSAGLVFYTVSLLGASLR